MIINNIIEKIIVVLLFLMKWFGVVFKINKFVKFKVL